MIWMLCVIFVGIMVILYFTEKKVSKLDETLIMLSHHVEEIESRRVHLSESDESLLKHRLTKLEKDFKRLNEAYFKEIISRDTKDAIQD